MMNESYSPLTDSQWQVITQILDDKRKRWHDLRSIIEAILWLNYTGVQWRQLSKRVDTPPWQTVYYHFRQFIKRGVWEQILDTLVVTERKRQARKDDTPSLLAIDSQSVKIM
jgi:putative transposase